MYRLVLLLVTGCSSILGIEDLSGPAGTPDAPLVDAPTAPAQIRITGSTQLVGGMQPSTLPGIRVEFVRMPDRAPLATQTTSPNGDFVFVLATGGVGLAGYARIDAGSDPQGIDSYRESRTYSGLLVADTTLAALALTETLVFNTAQAVNIPIVPNSSLAFILVGDNSGMARPGVELAVDSNSTIVYCDDTNVPDLQLGSTTRSGLAWAFNIPVTPTATITASVANQTVGQILLDSGTASVVHVVPFRTQ